MHILIDFEFPSGIKMIYIWKNVYFNKSVSLNRYDGTLFSKILEHRDNTKDTLIKNINCSKYK